MIKLVEDSEIKKQYEYMEKVKERVNGLKYYINIIWN